MSLFKRNGITMSTISRMLMVALPVTALVAPIARAATTVIAVPTSPSASASQLSASGLTTQVEPVFSDGERKVLAQLGKPDSGRILKVRLKSLQAADGLRRYIKARRLPFRIERNPIVVARDVGDTRPASGANRPDTKAAGSPDDPKLTSETLSMRQWGLVNTGAPQAVALDDINSLWIPGKAGEDMGLRAAPAESTTSPKVTVAILDTGIDADHPDLMGQVYVKQSECKALAEYTKCLQEGEEAACDAKYATTDTDGNGYPMDCLGWHILTKMTGKAEVIGGPDTDDELGHGTHVAGIIGAAANGTGVRGVAQNVRILPVKVIEANPNQPIRPQDLDDDFRAQWPGLVELDAKARDKAMTKKVGAQDLPSPKEKDPGIKLGFGDIIARGMLYAIRSGAQVINMSLAWPAAIDSQPMRDMVELARSRGIVVVSSAGNDSTDASAMPCAYDGVFCVAAYGADGSLAHYSNFGPSVDIAAPGTTILSTWPRSLRASNYTEYVGYEIKNGTSMASPFVAGAIARMISSGMTGDEAQLRLMAYARPTAEPAYAGASKIKKSLRSGNADVGAALAGKPVPLILPATKRMIGLEWNRASRELPVRFSVRNAWAPAANVRIQASVSSFGVHLATSDYALGAVAAGETRELTARIVIDDVSFDGRFDIELAVVADGRSSRIRVPLEVSFVVSPSKLLADPSIRQLPFDGKIPEEAEFSSVDDRELIAITKTGVEDEEDENAAPVPQQIQLIRRVSGSAGADRYGLVSTGKLTPLKDSLLLMTSKIDFNLDGNDDYVFVFQVGKQGLPKFRFQFFDAKMQPIGKLDFDNKLSVISENHQWMKTDKNFVPAWIGWGFTPDAEKKPYDPWDPNVVDITANHFYYFDGAAHTVAAPEDWVYLQLLAPTAAQRKAGAVPVILAKGETYEVEYATAEVRGGKLSELKPIALDPYRMLAGLGSIIPILSLDGTEAPGTAFAGPTNHGGSRSSFVVHNRSFKLEDQSALPSNQLDSIVRMTGAFWNGAGRTATYSENHYELQFDDSQSGRTLTTNLNRFSYLPSFIVSRSFFPVVAESRVSREPAILVPAGIGAFIAAEVIYPRRDASGAVSALARPAALRMEAGEGCVGIDNPISASTTAPGAMLFFCGDRFVEIPLSLKAIR